MAKKGELYASVADRPVAKHNVFINIHVVSGILLMTRAILLHREELETGPFSSEIGMLIFRVVTPKDLKQFSNTHTHIVDVDVDFFKDEWSRRTVKVNKLVVKAYLGVCKKEEARVLANHINNMRDISFCVRHDCMRRKTCERYLPKREDTDENELFTFILIEDPVNCTHYYPKFLPAYVGCKLECPKKDMCQRYGETEYTIDNKDWTEQDIASCDYYKGKRNG